MNIYESKLQDSIGTKKIDITKYLQVKQLTKLNNERIIGPESYSKNWVTVTAPNSAFVTTRVH
jgi:hypothetical protein